MSFLSSLTECLLDGLLKQEFLAAMFDRFRQADSSSTRSHGGLGLGLAIAKESAELQGRTVRATSEGLGKGPQFIISLAVRPILCRRQHRQFSGMRSVEWPKQSSLTLPGGARHCAVHVCTAISFVLCMKLAERLANESGVDLKISSGGGTRRVCGLWTFVCFPGIR